MVDRKFVRTLKVGGLLALTVALVALGGCSCKEYEEQIMQLDAQIAELQGHIADEESLVAERDQIVEDLRGNLQDCKADNAALVEASEEVIMITVPDQVTYAASQVIVLDTMVPTLEAIARTIRDYPEWYVYVEGHTDSRKISEEWVDVYPSNWELGAFRSAAVVRYMVNNFDLDPERFAVVSYGPMQPVDDNETAEGRSANRRVTMVMHKPGE
ncbi:MAG: OmpA family protein [bacterium]|nr:OmpA family protein [bacterium]